LIGYVEKFEKMVLMVMMVINTVQEKALNATDILYEYFFVLRVSW